MLPPIWGFGIILRIYDLDLPMMPRPSKDDGLLKHLRYLWSIVGYRQYCFDWRGVVFRLYRSIVSIRILIFFMMVLLYEQRLKIDEQKNLNSLMNLNLLQIFQNFVFLNSGRISCNNRKTSKFFLHMFCFWNFGEF